MRSHWAWPQTAMLTGVREEEKLPGEDQHRVREAQTAPGSS